MNLKDRKIFLRSLKNNKNQLSTFKIKKYNFFQIIKNKLIRILNNL